VTAAAARGDQLPRGASFPNLLELSLGYVVMKDRDLDFVLAASPVLEFLTLLGGYMLRLRHLLLVLHYRLDRSLENTGSFGGHCCRGKWTRAR
jgi:hypothetical protein